MDFKKMLSAPLHAGGAVVHGLTGDSDQEAAKAQVLQMLGNEGASDIQKFTPPSPATSKFELPPLDETLSPQGLKNKAAAEQAGQPFVPGEDDYADSGPYGYLHKKSIHDALQEYEAEIRKNTPHIDYEGIMKRRMSDLAAAPPEHHANPLYLLAMGMGNPEHAQELVATHNKTETDANIRQAQRWNELLDMKQQALEGSIKQAMAEGDQRKIISGKWLEGLAQIEEDKAKLAGQQSIWGQRNDAAERRANLRGQWALAGIKQRADAMLQAAGLRAGSAEYRSMMDNSRTMLDTLIRKGTSPEDAYDQVNDWIDEQLSKRPAPNSGAAPARPVSGGAPTPASPAAPSNPMEAEIQRNRSKKP